MNGSDVEPGLIPRAIEFLSQQIEQNVCDWNFSLEFSMFEIYNKELIDLLDPSKKLCLVRNEISNLTNVVASSNERLLPLWSKNIKNRKTSATIGNSNSSRSHAITQLKVTAKSTKQQLSRIAKINFVDLAGSESPKDTENMTETIAINSSLSALTGVVIGLKKKHKYVDYNESLLTQVLQPSLSGESKTLLITTLTTTDVNACTKTLRFVSTMSKCKTNSN